MGYEHDQINNMPKVVTEKTNIPNVIMKIQVANQKKCRGNYSGDHTGAMRGHASAGNHVPSGNQKHGAGSVQAGEQGREVGVLLGDHILAIKVLAITFWRSGGGP